MMAAHHGDFKGGKGGRYAAGDTELGHWTSVLVTAVHYMIYVIGMQRKKQGRFQ